MTQVITKSDFRNRVKTMPTPQGGEVLSIRDKVTLPSTYSLSDILSMMPLPADCVPVDVILDSDDVDTGTSITLSVGILKTDDTDISTTTADGGAAWISNSTVGQAGGLVRPTTKTITRVKPSNSDRYLGVKVTAAGSATAGEIGITLLYRARHYELNDT